MKWPSWLYRLVPYLGRRQAAEDLQEELRLHLELERERQRDGGLSEDDALREARRKLGNGTLIIERTRDIWGWRWLDELGRNARHVLRSLRRSPGFAGAVVLVLALGIGANTAMFGIVYGVLLRPLPYPDADAIVRVGESLGSSGVSDMWLSNRSMPLLVESAESFEQLAAYQDHSVESASLDGAALSGARVSPSLFPLLRAAPHLGRLFTEEEARVGANPVVLLSHGAWTRRFASDPDVVGTLVDLDGDPHTVVGVLAEDFYFPSPNSEFWTPYVMPPNMEGPAEQRVILSAVFRGLGRLRPGVSPTAGRHRNPHHPAAEQRRAHGAGEGESAGGRRSRGRRPRGSAAGGDGRRVSARAAGVGRSDGAGAVDRLRQCRGAASRARSDPPADAGRLRGARRGQRPAGAAAPDREHGAEPGRGRARPRRGGSRPARGACARADRSRTARRGGSRRGGARVHRGAVDRRRAAVRRGAAAPMVASPSGARVERGRRAVCGRLQAAAVEPGARGAGHRTGGAHARAADRRGLLLRSFVQLVTFDRGYDPINAVATAVTNPVSSQPPTTPEAFLDLRASHHRLQLQLLDEMTTRLEPLPDIEAFGLSWSLPFEWLTGSRSPVRPAGTPTPSNQSEFLQTWLQVVSPGYLEAMGFRLRAGRTVTRLDGPESPRVLVANETLARGLFGGEPAVGRRVLIGYRDEPWEVVGVVEDIVYWGLELTAEPRAEAFFSLAQTGGQRDFGFLTRIYATIRTTGDSLAAIPFLREAATAANPQATLGPVTTMEARLSDTVAHPRFHALFVGSFAGLALILVAFGIYGLLSYTVAQRRGEIGIRMALGARRGDILALVVRQGAALVVAGGVIGVFAAAASARVLESLLYGVDTNDPLTFIAAPLVVVAVALVACWFPARRAARVDPMKTLRFE